MNTSRYTNGEKYLENVKIEHLCECTHMTQISTDVTIWKKYFEQFCHHWSWCRGLVHWIVKGNCQWESSTVVELQQEVTDHRDNEKWERGTKISTSKDWMQIFLLARYFEIYVLNVLNIEMKKSLCILKRF